MPDPTARGEPVRVEPPADPRADTFAAWLSAAVALAALFTAHESLLAGQAVVFAIGALVGVRYAPYHALYRGLRALARRPGVPERNERAAAGPVRCGQGVGLLLAVLGAVGFLAGLPTLGTVAVGLLLAATLSHAALGFCPGAQLIYPIVARFHRPTQDPEQGVIV
jgi:hypothetical protein